MTNRSGFKTGQRITFKTPHVDGTGTIREVYPSLVIVMTDAAQETETRRLLGHHYLTVYNCQVTEEG